MYSETIEALSKGAEKALLVLRKTPSGLLVSSSVLH